MIDKAFLKQFCAREISRFNLNEPAIFTHPETGQQFSYGTDGHRMVIAPGSVEGCEPSQKINIASFLIEPDGVEVDAAALKAFLGCGEPTTRECEREGCNRGSITCVCPKCEDEHETECACRGLPIRLNSAVWLGSSLLNRALIADTLTDVSGSVRVWAKDATAAIHFFASDRHIVVMPMYEGGGDYRDVPRFDIKGNVSETLPQAQTLKTNTLEGQS